MMIGLCKLSIGADSNQFQVSINISWTAELVDQTCALFAHSVPAPVGSQLAVM